MIYNLQSLHSWIMRLSRFLLFFYFSHCSSSSTVFSSSTVDATFMATTLFLIKYRPALAPLLLLPGDRIARCVAATMFMSHRHLMAYHKAYHQLITACWQLLELLWSDTETCPTSHRRHRFAANIGSRQSAAITAKVIPNVFGSMMLLSVRLEGHFDRLVEW